MINILLIDDDEEMCQELKETLEEEHYSVCLACQGDLGMEYMKKGGYDLVLLDLKMPGINGRALLKYSKEKYPERKIIVLTGSAFDSSLKSGEAGGLDNEILKQADCVLNKPFDLDALLARIKELAGAKGGG